MLPIEYIEESVKSQTSHVVAGDVLDLFDLHDHMQLGVDCDGLKPDRVRPWQLEWVQRGVN